NVFGEEMAPSIAGESERKTEVNDVEVATLEIGVPGAGTQQNRVALADDRFSAVAQMPRGSAEHDGQFHEVVIVGVVVHVQPVPRDARSLDAVERLRPA